MHRPRIVVLISGSGSNLQALIDASQNLSNSKPELQADIVAVISNRPAVKGLQRAENAGIEAVTLDHKTFINREAFDSELLKLVRSYSADLVILAGFMRILTPVFLTEFHGKLLNIHPSLLPKFAGLNTHQRAIDAGEDEHGVTVHFVTEELDGGPPIIQAVVPIEEGDTADQLAQRVLSQEHLIYPIAAQWFVTGRLSLVKGRALLDGLPLGPQGIRFSEHSNHCA